MRYALLLLLFFNFTAGAQALRDINYNFLYDPSEPFSFRVNTIRSSDGWTVLYNFTLRDTSQRADQFLIQWDIRTSLGENEGATLDASSITREIDRNKIEGKLVLPVSTDGIQILTTRILNNAVRRVWIFYKILDPNYPVDAYLTTSGKVIDQNYIKNNTPVTLSGGGEQKIISFYNDDFPAAAPAFSEGLGKVARSMVVDSTFTVPSNIEIRFAKTGLYLVQQDTSATQGIAFRVVDDYPRLAKVESLADPLVYVCTKQEFDRVKAAKGDKKAFDRVILSITGNTERARTFIRNYFRNVEYANYFFTSYKEGWKTDRGMIFILFGLPDELYRFGDREVWTYSKSKKASFTFVRSSTIFDPDNYVLVRDEKFQELWYENIDLWRNARF